MKTSRLKSTVVALFLGSHALSFSASYTVNNGNPGAAASGIQDSLGRTFRAGTVAGTSFPSGGGVSAGPGSVAIGVFTLSDMVLPTLSQAQLLAAFELFGAEGSFGLAGPFGSRGVFSRLAIEQVAASVFETRPMYLFAGNGATLASSTEFLVVRSDTVTFSAVNDGFPTPTTITFRPDNSTAIIGAEVPNVQTANTDASITAGWQMVPEPSTACLLVLGVIGLMKRRR